MNFEASASVQNELNIDNTLLLNIIDKLEDIESAVQLRNDRETERIAELMSKYSHPQKSAKQNCRQYFWANIANGHTRSGSIQKTMFSHSDRYFFSL